MVAWVKQALVPIRGIWSSRPSLDWLVVGLVVGAHAIAVQRGWFAGFTIFELSKPDRMRLFQTMATVSSLLFGFATASIAFFYGSAKGDRLDLLKKVMNDQLVRTWKAALGGPLTAVAVAVSALVVDVGRAGNVAVGWTVEVALLLLALRAIRLRWLFARTLGLLSLDIRNPQQTAATSRPPRVASRIGRREQNDSGPPIS